MLSWRDPKHPQAGGAEVVTYEVLRRMVQAGHQVTWFAARWPGAAAEQTLAGVRIVRAGRQWSVHYRAWRWLRGRLDDFDVVVDQINAIPFMTPWYVPKAKRRFFIHQLAREYWWTEPPGLFRLGAPLGYLLEPWMLRRYRGTTGMTVSESTKADLANIGIPESNLTIIPEAITIAPLRKLTAKSGPWTVVMVGRLTPAKYVHEGIAAFRELKARLPEARLWIVGGGPAAYRSRLERLVRRWNLADVTFYGYVTQEKKEELLTQAQVHLITSHREGWGLAVSEAAAVGTPSVGYDVPGVRDSIGESSLLGSKGQPETLAKLLQGLGDDPRRYETLRQKMWHRSRSLNYQQTTKVFSMATGLVPPSASATARLSPTGRRHT